MNERQAGRRKARRPKGGVDRTIGLSMLRPVAILYDGDFHELASFMLRGYAAQDRAAGGRSRPTVHGVANAYVCVFINVSLETVEDAVMRHGLDLGAVVD